MSGKLNLRQGEYEILSSKLQELHVQQSAAMKEFIIRLKQLTEYSGGFFTIETSEKMQMVLEEIEGQISPAAAELFKDSEEIMKRIGARIRQEDELS